MSKIVRANKDQMIDPSLGKGPAIQTISGKLIHFQDPDPKDIHIYDIAFGLHNQARYNGHLPLSPDGDPLTVAQHSVWVEEYVHEYCVENRIYGFPAKKMRLKALLHDAHEAYLGDVITPLKVLLGDVYADIENRLDDAICERFGVMKGMPNWLHHADKAVYAAEVRDLRNMDVDHAGKERRVEAWDRKLCIIPRADALNLFLKKYLELTNQ